MQSDLVNDHKTARKRLCVCLGHLSANSQKEKREKKERKVKVESGHDLMLYCDEFRYLTHVTDAKNATKEKNRELFVVKKKIETKLIWYFYNLYFTSLNLFSNCPKFYSLFVCVCVSVCHIECQTIELYNIQYSFLLHFISSLHLLGSSNSL